MSAMFRHNGIILALRDFLSFFSFSGDLKVMHTTHLIETSINWCKITSSRRQKMVQVHSGRV